MGIGISIQGAAAALIHNNTTAAMLLLEKAKHPNLSEEQLSNLESTIATLNSTSFGVGATMGPLLGSLFT